MNDKLYILKGCGGHARSIADAILTDFPDARIVFVDDAARPNEMIMGFPAQKNMPSSKGVFIPASGDNEKREIECRGETIESFVSKSSHMSRFAEIKDGVFVACGAHIGPESVIGRGSIVNTNAVVEHNVDIGEFCHIAPNTTICGCCKIGNLVLVGAGSTLKPCIEICDNVTIGAGSVVVDNVTDPGIYAGAPARKIRSK